MSAGLFVAGGSERERLRCGTGRNGIPPDNGSGARDGEALTAKRMLLDLGSISRSCEPHPVSYQALAVLQAERAASCDRAEGLSSRAAQHRLQVECF